MTTDKEPLIGAHQSIAGGIHHAFERGQSVGCRTLQVFTKQSHQWHAKPLTEEDVANYKSAWRKSRIALVIAHDSYLINLCAVDSVMLRKSRNSFVGELVRCEMLGIPFLNFHPGAHKGAGETDGIKRIVESLDIAHARTKDFNVKSVLETTAGQGTAIGWKFEHLRAIMDGVNQPDRMAVCIDTCHIFAAGYDIRSEERYKQTMQEFQDIIGFHRLVAFHVNDSKNNFASRVDRHEHIGKGAIGEEGFRLLMQDSRFREIPKILETPKGDDLSEDRMNLETLVRLARAKHC